MRDAIRKTPARPLLGISPIVLGNELFQTSFAWISGLIPSMHKQPATSVAHSPPVFGRFSQTALRNPMLHRKPSVVFSVHKPRRPSDRSFRHNLGDKTDPSPLLASLPSPHIKT